MALSDAWLRSVVGKERDKVLVKSDRDGLSVRVSPKGRVVFQYRYQWAGKGERLDIGTYPATGLKEAREEVIRLRGELESNRNPRLVKQAEKRKATEAMTVDGPKCFIFWGKTVQCWQSNSLTKQSVQNDCPCRFRNSFFKGKQHEN